MPNVKLDPRPYRQDLTDRECAKLLGAVIGGLCESAGVDTVKRAIDWWSQNESCWGTFRKMYAYCHENPGVDVATCIPFDDGPPKPKKC